MPVVNFLTKLGLDATDFNLGLKKADDAAKHFAKELSGELTQKLAAAFAIESIIEWTKATIEAASAVGDLAKESNLTVEEVQNLQAAAKDAGQDVNQYIGALIKLKKARAEAATGNPEAQAQLGILGINRGMSNYEALRQIGEARTPEQLLAAYDLIGVKAGRILESLKEIKQLPSAELISPEAVARLKEAEDILDRMKRKSTARSANFLSEALGGLEIYTDEFASNMKKFSYIFSMNPNAQGYEYIRNFLAKAAIAPLMGVLSAFGVTLGTDQSNQKFPALPLPGAAAAAGLTAAQREQGRKDWQNLFGPAAIFKTTMPKAIRETLYGPVVNDLTAIGGGIGPLGANNYYQTAQLSELKQINQAVTGINDSLRAIATDDAAK